MKSMFKKLGKSSRPKNDSALENASSLTKCSSCSYPTGDEAAIRKLPEYRYEHLNNPRSMRVFSMSPEKDLDAAVHGSHMEYDLTTGMKSSSPYVALSYTWGSDARPHVVNCNGHRISVTCALNSALRRLRSKFEQPFLLFADCICINQSTDELGLQERAEQVKLMYLIFGEAERVVVDLGDASPNSSDVLNLLDRLSKIERDHWDAASLTSDWLKDLGLPLVNNKIWDAVATFCNRRWFTRLWVVQEVALARRLELMDGCSFKSPTVIFNGIERARSIVEFVSEKDPGTGFSRHLRAATLRLQMQPAVPLISKMSQLSTQVKASRLTLGSILANTRFFDVTNKRDHAYAVMGMMDPKVVAGFAVEYRESLSSLSWRLTRFLIDHGEADTALCRLAAYNKSPTTSSWTLDIERFKNNSVGNQSAWISFNSDRVEYCEFNAGGQLDAIFEHDPFDESVLSVSGSRIGGIVRISDEYPHPDLDGSPLAFIPWNGKVQKMACKHFPDVPSAYVEKTCVRIMIVHGRTPPDAPASVEGMLEEVIKTAAMARTSKLLLNSLKDLSLSTDWADKSYRSRQIALFTKNADHVCKNRKFCITSDNRMGLVPNTARTGDVIAVFRGCSQPLVIRQFLYQYLIVGVAYIEGIMDGEAVGSEYWNEEMFELV